MMNLSQYKALFRASPYAYLVMTPDLTIVAASGAYLRGVQRTEEDIVGRYVFDAFPENPDDPESTNISEVRASLLRALAKGEPDTTAFVRYAVPIDTPEGRKFDERYWSTVHTPVFDDDGTPILVVQNPADVTDLYHFDEQAQVASLRLAPPSEDTAENFNRAQMHDALSRILNNEREHLRSLFNQAPGFVAVMMGPKHIFEMVNEAYYQLVGHRELIGKALWDAIPEVAGQGFEELLARVFTTGKAWSARAVPLSVQHQPNGPTLQRYIDLVYQPYKDEDGDTIGIFAQGYDVTDSVEAQAAKHESEARLRDGMEATKMVVWDWDLNTDELAYSENILSVLGCAPANMQSIGEYIHPEDREKISAAHANALDGAGSYQEVVRFTRPDNGKQIWVDSRGKVQFEQGRAARIRGVTVDVTERYQAELELKEANRKKDEFLAMLAHELRNPLAPISTAAELLKLTGAQDVRAIKASEVISRQVKHMTSLVDDLLDVSRVTRGLVDLELTYVDVNSVIASAVEQSRPLTEERRHTLRVHADPSESMVQGDRTRLVQVIANLLNNAAKYTPQGGEITLTSHTQDGFINISIADNGIGINDKLLPTLFELFTQAERTPDRAQGGLGIGLALVKTMVALHKGTITAHSNGPGTGSTFTISLPALTHSELEKVAATDQHSAQALTHSLRIMIVDDNADAAESLGALLEAQGHEIFVHFHPQDALLAAQKKNPDVFILDIGLPEIDGYELARRLRANPGTRDALFIALTGYGQAHDRVLARSAGFAHHFVKPLDVERLADVLVSL